MSEAVYRKFAILKFCRNSFVAFWTALKTHLGLFMPDQYYQVVVNDS